jgi:hypothetical protein
MQPSRRLIVLILVLLFTGGSHPGPKGPIDAEGGEPPEVRLVDATESPRQAEGIIEVFRWSIDRYLRGGLEVPSTTVTFHRARSECADRGGLWRSGADHSLIDVCVGGTRKRRQMLLHELAHAWVAANLDQVQQTAFVTRRGLQTWSDTEIEWAARGIEQAAMIIAWGLDERCEQPKDLRLDDATLADEFGRLTGRAPLCRTGG